MALTALHQIQTPALLVDLDIMESNLSRMAAFFKDRPCKLRPHFKNIKCIALAKKQIAAGAIGITTATIQETIQLVEAGIKSILIANEITGEANLKKVIELAQDTAITLAVDHEKIINDIARLTAGKKHQLGLVVDIDLGLKRCGVAPGFPALALAKKIIGQQLSFQGIMGYEGHLQRLPAGADTLALRTTAMQQLIDTKNLLLANHLAVNIVSTGGTGSYALAGSTSGVTEVQAGNYLLMDTAYAAFAPDFEPALRLLTTVISFTPGQRFILNAGIKEISAERGMPSLIFPQGAVLKALHAEHGIVELTDPSVVVEPGSNMLLSVYYSDGTVNLHRKLYGIRNDKVEDIFVIGR